MEFKNQIKSLEKSLNMLTSNNSLLSKRSIDQ